VKNVPKEWKDLSVNRGQMLEGIKKCKENITDYLLETELLMSQGKIGHALILAEFAIEEFGKILVIKRAFELDQNDPFVIKGKKFYDHVTKSRKAWAVLDKKFKILYDEGVCLPNTIFERGVAIEYTLADHEGRLRSAFVDYCSGQWLLENNVKEAYLRNLIAEIRNKLQTL
jgi:AbiV family abortive infection protein